MSFVSRNHPQQVTVRGPLDEVDDRGTPPELFNGLNDRYGPFTLDVAASTRNAKCETFYTRSDDGLQQPWTGVVWCNPPYSDLTPWLRKAWSEWRARSGHLVRIVMLVPANRTEQAWVAGLRRALSRRPGLPVPDPVSQGTHPLHQARPDRDRRQRETSLRLRTSALGVPCRKQLGGT